MLLQRLNLLFFSISSKFFSRNHLLQRVVYILVFHLSVICVGVCDIYDEVILVAFRFDAVLFCVLFKCVNCSVAFCTCCLVLTRLSLCLIWSCNYSCPFVFLGIRRTTMISVSIWNSSLSNIFTFLKSNLCRCSLSCLARAFF